MQNLTNFDEKFKEADESLYDFFEIDALMPYLFGAPIVDNGNCYKLDNATMQEMSEENLEPTTKALLDTNAQTSGVRLRFYSDSKTIIIKAMLGRVYPYQKMTGYCSSGFDIYVAGNDCNYHHVTVTAPDEGIKAFAYLLKIPTPKNYEIVFPLYNRPLRFALGIEKGSKIALPFPFCTDKPIVFYGNSRTQGASASRSGNAYVNIISRQLNCDVINYSFSAACRAELAIARHISEKDSTAVVIDYTHNAKTIQEFYQRYEPFYMCVRKNNPNIPIILIGAICQPIYDNHIQKVFTAAKERGERTYYIKLDTLFAGIDYELITMDGIHYTDVGMYLVADKICEYLKQTIDVFN